MVERTPGGSRFIWTLAIEPAPPLKPVLRLTDPITTWIVTGLAHGIRSQVG